MRHCEYNIAILSFEIRESIEHIFIFINISGCCIAGF